MDDGRFDALARALGVALPRRAAGAALLAALFPAAGAAELRGPCGDGGPAANACRRDADCCTGVCAKPRRGTAKRKRATGRCRCRRAGQPCTEARNCCRARGQALACVAGRCAPPPCAPPCGPCERCARGRCAPDPRAAGAPCGPAGSCAGGTATPRGRCAGDGTCAPDTPTECAPYRCAGEACADACAADGDCVGAAFCDARGRCAGDRAPGEPCRHGGQCASGHCADGACCDRACGGACEACDRAGKAGTCGPMADGAGCGGGVCCGGACAAGAQCCGDAQCGGATPRCAGGSCVACAAAADCAGGCCDGGECVADGACCPSGGVCAGGACAEPAATVADCGGRCDCDETCSGIPIRASVELCGRTVACPPCPGGCAEAGCPAAGVWLPDGPEGDAYYCRGRLSGDCDFEPCPSGSYCAVGSTCFTVCTGA